MGHDWLLVETLGTEPAVVARGRQLTDLVPLTSALRRSPDLAAIQTAVTETVSSGKSLASITPKGNRVIRTEPVRMTDGTVHGVHVWVGPATAEPPERAVPGPLVWNLTTGVATDTPQSLLNSGLDPDADITRSRAFADDLPSRALNPAETHVVSKTVGAVPGATYCKVWRVAGRDGAPIAVAFVTRVALEAGEGGRQHLIARAMNWRGEPVDQGKADYAPAESH